MGDLVEIGVTKLVEVKPRLGNLPDFCRAKKCKGLESVTKTVGLDVKQVVDADGPSSPGAQLIVDPLKSKLSDKLAANRASVVSIKTKESEWEEVCDEVQQEYDDIVKRLLKKAGTKKNHTVSK